MKAFVRSVPRICLCFFLMRGLAQTSAPSVGAPVTPEQAVTLDRPEKLFGQTDALGSTNVPMDSWVYAALSRLAGMGLVSSQSVSIRPWTRAECLRQIREAETNLSEFSLPSNTQETAEDLLEDLTREFAEPQVPPQLVVESAYVRYGAIGGPALADSYHFGQTWWNDFGRPLQRGGSALAGYSFRATRGRFFFYDRQELQQNPGTLGITSSLSNLYTQLDIIPLHAPVTLAYAITPPTAAYLRQRPLELYAGVSFLGNNLSFGKQSLYWGPTVIGPLAFSNNAEPTYNLRLVSTRPHLLPFVPSLGTYRFDVVFGKLSGHRLPARPYFNGQKIELTFRDTLEVSFTRWSVLWGVGHPMTLGSLRRNLFSTASTGTVFSSSYPYGDRTDPGDRKSGFDFNLHVPGLRQWVTLYADAYADDELNPIDAPRRVAWSPGIYVSHFPYLPKVDLRFEMASTEELSEDEGGARFYINSQYLDSNTNKGFLLGSAVGRDARAFQGWLTYWRSARSKVAFSYRQTKGGLAFLPGGSTASDGSLTWDVALSPHWSAQAFAQYERFLTPVVNDAAQHNGSGWLQITWNPDSKVSLRPGR